MRDRNRYKYHIFYQNKVSKRENKVTNYSFVFIINTV